MQEHPPRSSNLEHEVFVSRQAIYTPQLDVWSYVLRFPQAAAELPRGELEYQTIARGLLASILELGLDALVGEKLAFVPLTRGFLLLGYATTLPAERVVLLLPATLTVDQALEESLQDMLRQGYSLALDGSLAEDALHRLAASASFLTLDVSTVERSMCAPQVARLSQYARPLIAMQVQTWKTMQLCSDLGFAYMHGSFVCQPEHVKAPNLPGNRLALLRILAQLQNPRSSIDALVDLISQDVTLSYRLLRAINAAYYGLARRITSIREAVRMLGLTSITLWTSLMLLAGNHARASALLTIAMVRADMCAQLARALSYAHPDSALLVGLFSVLDAILDRPMVAVLETLPLTADIEQALLTHTGVLGAILRAVQAYEAGDWSAVLALGLDQEVVRHAYGHALVWAAGMHEALAQTAA